MKFAICQELFEDWEWDRQCRFISECGYTGIEIASRSHNDGVKLPQRSEIYQTNI